MSTAIPDAKPLPPAWGDRASLWVHPNVTLIVPETPGQLEATFDRPTWVAASDEWLKHNLGHMVFVTGNLVQAVDELERSNPDATPAQMLAWAQCLEQLAARIRAAAGERP